MNTKLFFKFFSLSNTLSLLRAPLAFLFLSQNANLRIFAIVLAMVTDSIDGYIARKCRSASRFGAILDPAMDKFFVYFALAVLLIESKIETWQAIAMISRDISLIFFATYLFTIKLLKNYEYKAIRWGKASTALQFIILICICMNIAIPSSIYLIFVLMGSMAFVELFVRLKVS